MPFPAQGSHLKNSTLKNYIYNFPRRYPQKVLPVFKFPVFLLTVIILKNRIFDAVLQTAVTAYNEVSLQHLQPVSHFVSMNILTPLASRKFIGIVTKKNS